MLNKNEYFKEKIIQLTKIQTENNYATKRAQLVILSFDILLDIHVLDFLQNSKAKYQVKGLLIMILRYGFKNEEIKVILNLLIVGASYYKLIYLGKFTNLKNKFKFLKFRITKIKNFKFELKKLCISTFISISIIFVLQFGYFKFDSNLNASFNVNQSLSPEIVVPNSIPVISDFNQNNLNSKKLFQIMEKFKPDPRNKTNLYRLRDEADQFPNKIYNKIRLTIRLIFRKYSKKQTNSLKKKVNPRKIPLRQRTGSLKKLNQKLLEETIERFEKTTYYKFIISTECLTELNNKINIIYFKNKREGEILGIEHPSQHMKLSINTVKNKLSSHNQNDNLERVNIEVILYLK